MNDIKYICDYYQKKTFIVDTQFGLLIGFARDGVLVGCLCCEEWPHNIFRDGFLYHFEFDLRMYT